ncbi:hypothetical protein LWI29_012280 [Acer saccharum]|uniref:Uncharacterized protein n=1 Tax=Acer saccharum TaxID=4024 RepID=A0AA39SUQ1_ACESA|nr:hypothetical protein LWI29_012280 [Acer saccharum]
MSERLGCNISFSECGGIEIEENWDKVKTIYVPTGVSFTSEMCAPLVATLPLEDLQQCQLIQPSYISTLVSDTMTANLTTSDKYDLERTKIDAQVLSS